MLSVVVPEKDFDREFQITLDKLELARFQCADALTNRDPATVKEMHRKFHYEISLLRDRLKNG